MRWASGGGVAWCLTAPSEWRGQENIVELEVLPIHAVPSIYIDLTTVKRGKIKYYSKYL